MHKSKPSERKSRRTDRDGHSRRERRRSSSHRSHEKTSSRTSAKQRRRASRSHSPTTSKSKSPVVKRVRQTSAATVRSRSRSRSRSNSPLPRSQPDRKKSNTTTSARSRSRSRSRSPSRSASPQPVKSTGPTQDKVAATNVRTKTSFLTHNTNANATANAKETPSTLAASSKRYESKSEKHDEAHNTNGKGGTNSEHHVVTGKKRARSVQDSHDPSVLASASKPRKADHTPLKDSSKQQRSNRKAPGDDDELNASSSSTGNQPTTTKPLITSRRDVAGKGDIAPSTTAAKSTTRSAIGEGKSVASGGSGKSAVNVDPELDEVFHVMFTQHELRSNIMTDMYRFSPLAFLEQRYEAETASFEVTGSSSSSSDNNSLAPPGNSNSAASIVRKEKDGAAVLDPNDLITLQNDPAFGLLTSYERKQYPEFRSLGHVTGSSRSKLSISLTHMLKHVQWGTESITMDWSLSSLPMPSLSRKLHHALHTRDLTQSMVITWELLSSHYGLSVLLHSILEFAIRHLSWSDDSTLTAVMSTLESMNTPLLAHVYSLYYHLLTGPKRFPVTSFESSQMEKAESQAPILLDAILRKDPKLEIVGALMPAAVRAHPKHVDHSLPNAFLDFVAQNATKKRRTGGTGGARTSRKKGIAGDETEADTTKPRSGGATRKKKSTGTTNGAATSEKKTASGRGRQRKSKGAATDGEDGDVGESSGILGGGAGDSGAPRTFEFAWPPALLLGQHAAAFRGCKEIKVSRLALATDAQGEEEDQDEKSRARDDKEDDGVNGDGSVPDKVSSRSTQDASYNHEIATQHVNALFQIVVHLCTQAQTSYNIHNKLWFETLLCIDARIRPVTSRVNGSMTNGPMQSLPGSAGSAHSSHSKRSRAAAVDDTHNATDPDEPPLLGGGGGGGGGSGKTALGGGKKKGIDLDDTVNYWLHNEWIPAWKSFLTQWAHASSLSSHVWHPYEWSSWSRSQQETITLLLGWTTTLFMHVGIASHWLWRPAMIEQRFDRCKRFHKWLIAKIGELLDATDAAKRSPMLAGIVYERMNVAWRICFTEDAFQTPTLNGAAMTYYHMVFGVFSMVLVMSHLPHSVRLASSLTMAAADKEDKDSANNNNNNADKKSNSTAIHSIDIRGTNMQDYGVHEFVREATRPVQSNTNGWAIPMSLDVLFDVHIPYHGTRRSVSAATSSSMTRSGKRKGGGTSKERNKRSAGGKSKSSSIEDGDSEDKTRSGLSPLMPSVPFMCEDWRSYWKFFSKANMSTEHKSSAKNQALWKDVMSKQMPDVTSDDWNMRIQAHSEYHSWPIGLPCPPGQDPPTSEFASGNTVHAVMKHFRRRMESTATGVMSASLLSIMHQRTGMTTSHVARRRKRSAKKDMQDEEHETRPVPVDTGDDDVEGNDMAETRYEEDGGLTTSTSSIGSPVPCTFLPRVIRDGEGEDGVHGDKTKADDEDDEEPDPPAHSTFVEDGHEPVASHWDQPSTWSYFRCLSEQGIMVFLLDQGVCHVRDFAAAKRPTNATIPCFDDRYKPSLHSSSGGGGGGKSRLSSSASNPKSAPSKRVTTAKPVVEPKVASGSAVNKTKTVSFAGTKSTVDVAASTTVSANGAAANSYDTANAAGGGQGESSMVASVKPLDDADNKSSGSTAATGNDIAASSSPPRIQAARGRRLASTAGRGGRGRTRGGSQSASSSARRKSVSTSAAAAAMASTVSSRISNDDCIAIGQVVSELVKNHLQHARSEWMVDFVKSRNVADMIGGGSGAGTGSGPSSLSLSSGGNAGIMTRGGHEQDDMFYGFEHVHPPSSSAAGVAAASSSQRYGDGAHMPLFSSTLHNIKRWCSAEAAGLAGYDDIHSISTRPSGSSIPSTSALWDVSRNNIHVASMMPETLHVSKPIMVDDADPPSFPQWTCICLTHVPSTKSLCAGRCVPSGSLPLTLVGASSPRFAHRLRWNGDGWAWIAIAAADDVAVAETGVGIIGPVPGRHHEERSLSSATIVVVGSQTREHFDNHGGDDDQSGDHENNDTAMMSLTCPHDMYLHTKSGQWYIGPFDATDQTTVELLFGNILLSHTAAMRDSSAVMSLVYGEDIHSPSSSTLTVSASTVSHSSSMVWIRFDLASVLPVSSVLCTNDHGATHTAATATSTTTTHTAYELQLSDLFVPLLSSTSSMDDGASNNISASGVTATAHAHDKSTESKLSASPADNGSKKDKAETLSRPRDKDLKHHVDDDDKDDRDEHERERDDVRVKRMGKSTTSRSSQHRTEDSKSSKRPTKKINPRGDGSDSAQESREKDSKRASHRGSHEKRHNHHNDADEDGHNATQPREKKTKKTTSDIVNKPDLVNKSSASSASLASSSSTAAAMQSVGRGRIPMDVAFAKHPTLWLYAHGLFPLPVLARCGLLPRDVNVMPTLMEQLVARQVSHMVSLENQYPFYWHNCLVRIPDPDLHRDLVRHIVERIHHIESKQDDRDASSSAGTKGIVLVGASLPSPEKLSQSIGPLVRLLYMGIEEKLLSYQPPDLNQVTPPPPDCSIDGTPNASEARRRLPDEFHTWYHAIEPSLYKMLYRRLVEYATQHALHDKLAVVDHNTTISSATSLVVTAAPSSSHSSQTLGQLYMARPIASSKTMAASPPLEWNRSIHALRSMALDAHLTQTATPAHASSVPTGKPRAPFSSPITFQHTQRIESMLDIFSHYA